MISAKTPQYTVISEKTLFDVLRDMWKAKFVMLGFAIVAALAAFIFLSLSNNYYQAEMIIAPASPMGFSTRGSAGAKASEGTISVQEADLQSNAAFVRFENIYSGASVASFLVKDEDFVSKLALDRMFEFSKGRSRWDAQSLSEYIEKRVHLEPVSGTSLRRLSYMHPDKAFAAEMVRRVHRITDEMIRASILVETNQRIDYLNKALAKASNPDHKRTLVDLMMEQERLKMMVSLDQAYAAAIIEPPYVLFRTRWPDKYVFYLMFVFVGLSLGYITYGLKHFKKS